MCASGDNEISPVVEKIDLITKEIRRIRHALNNRLDVADDDLRDGKSEESDEDRNVKASVLDFVDVYSDKRRMTVGATIDETVRPKIEVQAVDNAFLEGDIYRRNLEETLSACARMDPLERELLNLVDEDTEQVLLEDYRQALAYYRHKGTLLENRNRKVASDNEGNVEYEDGERIGGRAPCVMVYEQDDLSPSSARSARHLKDKTGLFIGEASITDDGVNPATPSRQAEINSRITAMQQHLSANKPEDGVPGSASPADGDTDANTRVRPLKTTMPVASVPRIPAIAHNHRYTLGTIQRRSIAVRGRNDTNSDSRAVVGKGPEATAISEAQGEPNSRGQIGNSFRVRVGTIAAFAKVAHSQSASAGGVLASLKKKQGGSKIAPTSGARADQIGGTSLKPMPDKHSMSQSLPRSLTQEPALQHSASLSRGRSGEGGKVSARKQTLHHLPLIS
eukprot:TRINITY_DN61881_c0_g1_i1.p1 TRINITY_DN61881_c0_g1~~TRINITY_DN61881_c0_g1_i1.p1  ORF type:complete len:451 (-),score=41.06 TRINITY_DN61881_c0_g1_i1:547-1899(-)